jgi:DNA processing protein
MGDVARVHTYRVLDRDYPTALRDLRSPPDPLCVRGQLLAGPSVAMVGTRDPSLEAEKHAHDLAFRLASSGVTVWSGGAVGIDAAAHRGALDAGGISVAVIGTGLDHCYPPQHAALYEELVLTGGALVSPFEPSQHAMLTTFPQRNGVLAALTQATVVVQAPIKSGARSTARFARNLGRPLFVIPAPPWDSLSAGNLAEAALGAQVLADEAQLFNLLGVPHRRRVLRHPPPCGSAHSYAPLTKPEATTAVEDEETLSRSRQALSPEAQAVIQVLSSSPLHLDHLCARSGLPTALVHAALLTLSIEAVVVEGPAGWFRRATIRKD